MDPRAVVQKKLSADETCLICTETALLLDYGKSPRYLAVVEKQDDHAIFLFTTSRVPVLSAGDLSVDQVLPVDSDLGCFLDSSNTVKSSDNPQAFRLRLKSTQHDLLLELPQQQSTTDLLGQIKSAKDLYTQNAGFGCRSTFSWLSKYSGASKNPFQDDVFDPLAHMNLTSNGIGQTVDVAAAERQGFEDDFSNMLTLNASNLANSQSRDSLDMLDRDEDEPDTVYNIQRQLGIGYGLEMPVGQKPVTAREVFVKRYMAQREEEFTNIEKLTVFCGTWNVNGQSPKEPLKEWLVVDDEPPDIYAIGFQELDLSKEAFIFTDSPREAEWQKAVKNYLHPKAKYRKVKSCRLVGILLIVFIQEKHIPNLHFLDSDQVATGIMGIMGNKGGVGIRMSVHNTSFCFINSHLAAHQEEFERRNQDYRDIDAKMKFKQFSPPLTIKEHDITFFIGDLNYRIYGMPIDEVKYNISNGLNGKLLPYDQLYMQLGKSDVFSGYSEGPIHFQPTYKYDVGSDNFDTSEKCRVPAWCDRILWKGAGVRQIRYDSHPQLRVSDHKPVSALFDAGIRVIDVEKSKKVYEDVMKKLDRIENEYLPQVKLDNTEFVFEDVKFNEPQKRVLTVANIGQVPVEFEFINKLDDISFCKPWLNVTPCKDSILPGDCCDISLMVFVDKDTAGDLNSKAEKMDDILVLHLTGGKDFFIPVSGKYIPSSYGTPIETLVQMHGPIREVAVGDLISFGTSMRTNTTADSSLQPYICPKEISRLVNHLFKYGKEQEDLFLQPGKQAEIQMIRDALDTGNPDLIPGSVHSVAEAMLLFLESLPQPVIPFAQYQTCLDCSNNFLLSKQALQKIPQSHRNVFKYLCAFLRELLKFSDKNNLEAKFLASLFGNVFLRTRPGKEVGSPLARREKARLEEAKKAAFVYHFLTNDYDE
ncbi:inositol polyphosphate 5-phosphatase OCRL-like [Haliotis rubra]|uniref:inositol polyphosphate 5-phosphatase OCRL-like n=1 Tax=Haliotis rubra TaxID=36100 RepID=UPI001EE5AAD9|nr:inositol polyphosphate 5-phosphatase OCRL-like [Haliotis rubra]